MKNIQFTSRAAGYKALAALALLASFAAAGIFVGLVMPEEFGAINGAVWILAAISVGSALFVWAVFSFIEPVRYDPNWRIAVVVLAPLCWLMLFLAAYLCLDLIIQRSIQDLQDIVTPMLHF